MEYGTITVRGDDVERLMSELTGPGMGSEKTRYRTDDFAVLAWERWDAWRTNSDLMVAVVMDVEDERTCTLAVMAGGGGEGALGLDWSVTSAIAESVTGKERSAETAAFEEAIEDIEETCESLGLEIETE